MSWRIGITFVLTLITVTTGRAAPRILSGHVPAEVGRLTSLGRLAGTNRLNLAIGLPLRDAAGLGRLLQRLYDPASPDYLHFLTPEQFAMMFGPTERDYQALIDFADTNGLTVTGKHPNRTLLDVNGAVSDIEKVFRVAMRVYQHPAEARTFYAPDTEPSLDSSLPVLDISGLSDFGRPHPNYVFTPAQVMPMVTPNAGSGPGGNYMGNDFRAAYVPGVSLNGAGQTVALVQFDGYLASDIAAYETKAGLPNVSLSNVLLNGFSGTPTGNGGEVEVSLDIEMAISMAPGLSQVIVYEGNPNNFIPNDVLNKIVTDNSARQISCSWTWSGGPNATTDQIFQQMAAQGQSFFVASGDSDSYKNGAVDSSSGFGYPAQSPNVTSVGGTVLTTTGPGGSYVSETVWNTRTWDSSRLAYVGSSGGISAYYAIPTWQQGVSMAGNGGSTTKRNFPDVSLTAANVYVIADNGLGYSVGGTSCASPLWAGFAALVNQQAAANGLPSVGFLNPAAYAIGKGANYASDFHDTTTGDNTSPDLQNPNGSTNQFYAVAGYDLCTGWGAPVGSNLINALAPAPNGLLITPSSGLVSIGPLGGPFTPSNQVYVLSNATASPLNWYASKTAGWVTLSSTGGTLAAAGTTNATIGINANALTVGSYSDTVTFTNTTSGGSMTRPVSLTVMPLSVYFFSLDTDSGWTRQGQWAFGHPTGQGGQNGFPDPANGATGTNVFGVNLNGNYSTSVGGPYYVIAGPLDFTGYTNVNLQFQRWLNTYSPPSVNATVEVSNNGTTWTQIFANVSGVVIADSSWTNCHYDISTVADRHANVYVRWGYRVNSRVARAYSGWNIDDIAFQGLPIFAPPVAAFTASPLTGPAPLTANFTDTSSGSITNRQWNFGDGGTTTTLATNVQHVYAAAGTNTVALCVSGPSGISTNIQSNYITVSPPLIHLVVNSSHGGATPPLGTNVYTAGTNLTCAVTNSPLFNGSTHYVCAGWSMTSNAPLSGSATNFTTTLTNNAVLTWLWATQYQFAASAGSGGTVTDSNGWYWSGSNAVATAVASNYYHFIGWTGDVPPGSETNNPLVLIVNEAKNVTATFAANLAPRGTPEWWLAQYGWTNNFDAAETSDVDGDGMLTWEEYVAGTDPTNRTSFLGLTAVSNTAQLGGGVLVSWWSVDGKHYWLDRSTNLLSVPAFDYIVGTNILGVAPMNTETDTTATGQGPYFYRVGVQ